MSKVKYGYNNAHEKAKLRRNLRRKEGIHKKQMRINNVKNNVYGINGYYITNTALKTTYETIIVPETRVPIKEYYREPVEINGKIYYMLSVRVIGEKSIPEHKKRKAIKHEWITIPEKLKRINKTKKWYKKISNKKIRAGADIYNGSNYKKVFDLAWSIT